MFVNLDYSFTCNFMVLFMYNCVIFVQIIYIIYIINIIIVHKFVFVTCCFCTLRYINVVLFLFICYVLYHVFSDTGEHPAHFFYHFAASMVNNRYITRNVIGPKCVTWYATWTLSKTTSKTWLHWFNIPILLALLTFWRAET